MKNTMQRYGFYVIKHGYRAKNPLLINIIYIYNRLWGFDEAVGLSLKNKL